MSDRPLEAKAPPAEASRDLPYRQGVGIMLINRQGRVFVAQRIDMPSVAWQMPQGGIDKGESPLEAAWRELGEETGTDKAEVIGESRDWYVYDLPVDSGAQALARPFPGADPEMVRLPVLGLRRRHRHRHRETGIFRLEVGGYVADLPELIVPFKRTLYTQLIAELGHFSLGRPNRPIRHFRFRGDSDRLLAHAASLVILAISVTMAEPPGQEPPGPFGQPPPR